MKNLLRKGHKTVENHMKKAGYNLYDCIETEKGYEAEWYKSHAGITLDTMIICFNKNWRVTEIK